MPSYSMGPVNVYKVLSDGSLVYVGPTEGGVSISLTLDTIETLYDEDGTTPVSSVIGGMGGQVSLPLTALTFQRIQFGVPGSELVYGASSRLYIGNPVAANLSDYSTRLLLKRIKDGVETTEALDGDYPNWVTILKSAPIDSSAISYAKDGQQIFEVTLQIYPDDTVLSPTGNKSLLIFGTPPGAVGPVLGADAGFLQGIQLDADSPINGEILTYDSATGTWISASAAVSSLIDLTDVTGADPTAGFALVGTGTDFLARLLTATDMGQIGTSFPASPTAGDEFYHTTYKMLFRYEGSKWNPVFNFGATLSLYVDGVSGSDAVGKGFGSGTDATATIQYCWANCIPSVFQGILTVYVTAGTYSEQLLFEGKIPGGSSAEIIIQGTLTAQDTGTADADSTAQELEDDLQGWGVNEHAGRLVRITGGTASGQNRFIRANDTDTLNIGGRFTTALDATSTYEIDTLSTVVSPGAGNVGALIYNQPNLTIKYIKFSGGLNGVNVRYGSQKVSFEACEFDTQTGDALYALEFVNFYTRAVYIHAAALAGIRLESSFGIINDAYVVGNNTASDNSRGGVVFFNSSYGLLARGYIDGNDKRGVYCTTNSSISFGSSGDECDVINHGTAGEYGILAVTGGQLNGEDLQDFSGNDIDYATNTLGLYFARDYPTLQDAIDAAGANGGGTVIAEANTTYNEVITITLPYVTLQGAGRSTLIDGGSTGHAIAITGSYATVMDLAVQTTAGGGFSWIGIRVGSTTVGVNITRVIVIDVDLYGFYIIGDYCNVLNCTILNADDFSIVFASSAAYGSMIGCTIVSTRSTYCFTSQGDYICITANHIASGSTGSSSLGGSSNNNTYVANYDAGAVANTGTGNVVYHNS